MPPKKMIKASPQKFPNPRRLRRRQKLLSLISKVFITLGLVLIIYSAGPFLQQEALFYISQIKNQQFFLKDSSRDGSLSGGNQLVSDSPFARLISTKDIQLEAVDKNFGLVIERLGINVPVVKDVPVTNLDAYMSALEHGVAHAAVSKYPSQNPGNVYIFAHASLNFWRLGKYATVFNLLRHLKEGDAIHVFYEGQIFVYKVVSVERYKGFEVYPLTRPVLEPLLTLQTCDPPGTTINRLVVTAKLVEVR